MWGPLPVGHSRVEYLVGDVLHHLGDEVFLYGSELLAGVILCGGGELAFKVLGMVLVVDKPHVDSHLQLHLAAVAVAGDALVVLVEARNLARELQVPVFPHLTQLGLSGVAVGELCLEDALHGGPHIGTADGEVVYLDGLGLLVVDAGTVELDADGA